MEHINCPNCGAKMKEHWHSLTKGLVHTLVKIKTAVIKKNENKIHPIKDCQFNNNERNNMQKLRYHGLIARADGYGTWLLTRRGSEFLKGQIEIPKRVRTYRNKIVGKSEQYINVADVYQQDLPYWEESFEYQSHESKDPIDREIQQDLFQMEVNNG